MAKINFLKQLIFGSTGSTSKFGQVGSINTTKTNTKDPATIQSLAAFQSGLEAVLLNGTFKIALEDLNSMFLLITTQIAYLQQMGVCEWSSDVTYYANSFVNLSGALYRSLTNDNTGNNPASSPGNWILASGDAPGTTKTFAGPLANIPAGWIYCDGSAVSRITYANLFAAIGTAWGSGDGSTTFNIPDKRGRVSVGYNSGDADFNAVGKTIGEKSHVLTVDEIPAHAHTYPIGSIDNPGGMTRFQSNQIDTGTTSMVGGGGAHNNIQPSAVEIPIIKY